MALGGRHVQRRAVHLGAGVSAHAGPQQDVGGGVMAVLGSQVERRRPKLQGNSVTRKPSTTTTTTIHVNTGVWTHPVRGERRSVGHQVPDLIVLAFPSRLQ